ncbi:MAG: BatA domain-containing protein [Desulfobacterales bacterium]|nr:MAG: BatA domain-containing protein [Desulfobacterales bacterium]
MNLTFFNPLLLFGLAGVILPILIHRITRKKVTVKKFSAVHLILRSQQIAAKPQRLKHLLLLALRILAVAVLVFMMARPVLIRPGFAERMADGAKVVIFDNSLSMGYLEDRGRRYDIAQTALKEALDGFAGHVLLIPTADGPAGQAARWINPKTALQEIHAIPLSYSRGHPAAALTAAYQALKDLKTRKQIVVLSDMARSDWQELDLSRIGPVSDAQLLFLRIGSGGRNANVCIKAVRLAENELVAGVPARLEVTVSNLSDQAATTLVQIELSDVKFDQKSIEIPAGQDATISFDLRLDTPGWVHGKLTLTADRLPADDIFYFPLWVREKVNVLVVDGDPKTSLRASEHYYLVSALRAGAIGQSPFTTRVITEDEMARADLNSFDVLFLLNVARPDPSRLASFLESQKALFIFLGDRVDLESYNRFTFAPWQIRYLIDLGERSAKAVFDDTPGSAFKFFPGLEQSLKKASFHTYFKVEAAAEHLILLQNQDPLLVQADAGASKVIMFTSSADLDWNDLPLTAAFLPLVQRLVLEATDRRQGSLPAWLTVGDPAGRDGRPLQQLKGPRNGPGIYQYLHNSRKVHLGVNTPHEESDLLKISADELKKKLGNIEFDFLEYQAGRVTGLQTGRKPLWPLLLVFLLAVLAFEMMIANGIVRFKQRP